MTAEEILALLQVIARLQASVTYLEQQNAQLQSENSELKAKISASGSVEETPKG